MCNNLLKLSVISTLTGCLMLLIPYQASSYCDPDAVGNMYCSDFDEITGFHIGKFSKTSFDPANCDGVGEGYGDYTDDTLELQRGNTYSVIMEFSGGDNSVAMWLDKDQDSSFSANDLLWRSEAAIYNDNNPAVFEVTIPSNATLGATRMRAGRLLFDVIDSTNFCGTPPAFFFEGQYQDYTVDIVESTPTPYEYDSSYVFNASTDLAVQGEKAEVIGLNIQVLGNEPPDLDLEEFSLNTHITSHDSVLDEAEILYTGNSPEFDTSGTLYGTYNNPDNDFTISGSQNLTPGNNFFWLVYDVKNNVGPGHEISAELESMMINGNAHIPNPTSTPETRSVIQPMEGVYTIGTSSGTDFETINDAVDSIESNLISGTVHFEIEPGTYNEEVSIGSIDGINSEDTVVFDGLHKDSVTVSSNDETFTIFSDYITLQNMTIETTNDDQFNPTIRIWNQDHVNILHNKISKPYEDFSGHFIIRAEGDYLNIGHNHFVDGGLAVQFEEGSHQHFYHNVVDNAGDGGVHYAFNEDNYYPKIWGNEFYHDPSESGRGIYLREVYGNFLIKDNIIISPHDGIYIYEHTTTSAERSIIANNFIVSGLESTSGLRGGIRLNEAEDIDIVFNSFNALNPRAINSRDENVYGIRLFNNSFQSTDYDMYFDEFNAIDSSNYNNFNGQIEAGINYSDLSDWQSGSFNDANSQEGDPGYIGTEDLRIENAQLFQQGTPWGNIEHDIFGNERPASSPSIGAYEHIPYDLELVELFKPDTSLQCGIEKEDIEVIIENHGGNPVSDFDIYAYMSGDLQDTFDVHYNDSIEAFGGKDTVTLGDFNSNAGSNFEFKIYHNLSADQNRENDTINAHREFDKTPESPVTINDTACGDPGVSQLVAFAPESEMVWYNQASGGTEIHRGDTFQTADLTSSATFYVISEHEESGCQSTEGRQSVSVVSNPLPTAELIQGNEFTGISNDGNETDPDQGCVGALLEYEIEAPAGTDNADYDAEWTVTSWEIVDENANHADSAYFNKPRSGVNGTVGLVANATETGNTFEIVLHTENLETGCTDTSHRFVSIYDVPEVEFDVEDQICLGEHITIENMTSISDQQEMEYVLEYGDGTQDSLASFDSITHHYQEAGTYEINLTAISEIGCYSEYSQNITVNESVEAEYELSNSEACISDSITFENLSTAGDDTLNYEWNFGDGNASTTASPVHSFDEAGAFEVTLVATSNAGCNDTTSQIVTIHELPQEPSFASENQCINDSVRFTPNEAFSSYHWNFGDGNTSEDSLPLHSYDQPGNYDVTLEVSNEEGCQNHATQQVEIFELPESDFGFELIGAEISLTPVEEGYDTYHWEFGDGNSSNETSPVHTFDEEGEYEIVLQVTTEEGCTSVSSEEVNVKLNSLAREKSAEKGISVYPNPADQDFTVEFNLEAAGNTQVTLLDVSGRKLAELESGSLNAGQHQIVVDVDKYDLANGYYLIHIQNENGADSKPVKISY